MSRRLPGLLTLLLLLCLSGCFKTKPVDLRKPTRTFSKDDYEDVRDHWSRSRRVIRSFDTVIQASVTYQSQEFVSAYAARFASDYGFTKAERQRWLAARLSEVRSRHEFYFTVTTSNREWNDFERKNSIWRITLEDDRGTRVQPLVIKRLKITAVHRTYFPETSVFHRAYLLLFPNTVGGKPFITSQSKWFRLRVAGPLASTHFGWNVKRVKKGRPPRAQPRAQPRAKPRAQTRAQPAPRSDPRPDPRADPRADPEPDPRK